MSGSEKYGKEGKLEKLARLGIWKSVGGFALAAAGTVLLPPVGAAIATGVAVGEGLGVVGSKIAHDKLKDRRLRKVSGR